MNLTVGEYLRQLAPGLFGRWRAPLWPPDAFALAAALLYRSGTYTAVVEEWPPDGRDRAEWCDAIESIGEAWREQTSFERVPAPVRGWWRLVFAARDIRLEALAEQRDVVHALLQIVSAADEASAGVGFLGMQDWYDAFEYDALALLASSDGRTVARDVDPSRVVVLPKAHTPQTGITIRSLTHHLALYLPGEVTARWWVQHSTIVRREWCFNLLLLPWPQTVLPRHFHQAAMFTNVDVAEGFGFFSCGVRDDPEFDVGSVIAAVEAAREHLRTTHGDDGCDISGIVFPELSLRPNEPRDIVEKTGAFVVGGVGEDLHDGQSRNYAAVALPVGSATLQQSKHHRWRLNASQIEQYGLGGRLDPTVSWWENSRLDRRELNFFALSDWLTFCVFICEDLARLDPVSDLVRSVGPHLVIALLLDGPQLKSRWPARYATVLAEDPGCSVLTLTSLGMALASVPEGMDKSRVIALWKDGRLTSPKEIALEEDAVGVVLSLRREYVKEHSADGRNDFGTTAHLRLDRVHQVKLPPKPSKYRLPHRRKSPALSPPAGEDRA